MKKLGNNKVEGLAEYKVGTLVRLTFLWERQYELMDWKHGKCDFALLFQPQII